MLMPLIFAASSLGFLNMSISSIMAQPVDSFYQGRTVSLLIGIGPGGGNDAWARTVGQHIGRHIPGKPTIVPQNMPGAAGLKMTNYLYNAAPKDGSVLAVQTAGVLLEPLLGGEGVDFDALKLTYIGSVDRDKAVCVARTDATIQSMDELMTTELIVGASGSGGNTTIVPLFFANALNMKFRIIYGYKGTNDVLLAIDRGEVYGMCSSYDPLRRQSMFKAGKLRVLFQAAIEKDERIDAPTPVKLVQNEAQREALAFFLAREELGRPFVAPPGVPENRVRALRRAFDATMIDPAFLSDADKQEFNTVAMTGEETASLLARIYKTPHSVVRLTAKALGRELK